MSYELDEFGNVVCHGEPDCETCDPMLCMQVYDEATNTWTSYCPDCLEANVVVTHIDWQEPNPSGQPTSTYPGGVCPSGGVVIECGQSSLLIEHTFKKEYQYKVDGGWPWALPIMQGWNAQQRRDMENSWASANVPVSVLAQFALDAFNDAKAKGKVAGITCGPCPTVGDDTAKVCPLIVRKGTLKASDTTGSNGRMTTSGRPPNQTLNVVVTLTGKIRMWVFCNKDGC